MIINLRSILLWGFILLLSGIACASPNPKVCRKKNGKFPIPGSLCRGYYECKNYVPTEKMCIDGEHFNAVKERCDWEDLYPCLEKFKDKECQRQNGLFLKPGTNCKKYYRCCNGKAKVEACSGDLLFDPSKEKCEWPDLYTCIENQKDKECQRENGLFLKPGTNCKKYYRCSNGKAKLETCSGDLLFDPSKEKCEWPDLYTCIESLSTTKKVSSTVTIAVTSTPLPKTSTDPAISKTTIQKTTASTRIVYSTHDPDISTNNPDTSTVDQDTSTVDLDTSTVDRDTSTVDQDTSTLYPDTSSVDLDTSTVNLDTSTADLDSSTVDLDSSTVDPDSSTVDPDSSTVDIDTSTVDIDTSTVDIDTSTVDLDSSTVNPDSSTIDPDSSTVDLDSSTVDLASSTLDPDSSTLDLDSSTVDPDSSTVDLDSSTVYPDTRTVDLDSSTVDPDTSTVDPDTSTADPDISTVDPDTSTVDPDTSTVDPDTSTVDLDTSTIDPDTSELTTTEISTSQSIDEASTLQPTTSEIPITTQTTILEISSTHSTDHTIFKENKEGDLTEPIFETTTEATSSTSTVEVTTSGEVNIMCPEPNGYFPHPTDKHKFVGCVGNIAHVLTCPSDLVYKHHLRRCDHE